jgi:hypothetical protein
MYSVIFMFSYPLFFSYNVKLNLTKQLRICTKTILFELYKRQKRLKYAKKKSYCCIVALIKLCFNVKKQIKKDIIFAH